MKNIICGIDEQYCQHCGAMLLSLFRTTDDDITVYLLSLGLSERSKLQLTELVTHYHNQISFIDISPSMLLNFPMKTTDYLSMATYLRLFIPELLPLNIDKALYVDSDIIFEKDITELYNLDITKYALAGIEDAPNRHALRLSYPEIDSYFNAGFILLNIKYLREINFTREAMSYIKANEAKIVLHDQDVLNALLHGKALFISIKWNMLDCFYKNPPFVLDKYANELNLYLPSPSVVHFSGPLKPWHRGCPHPLRKLYFKYSRQLAWGCRRVDNKYVFKIYKFPVNLLVWLGCTPERADWLYRKIKI